MATMTKAQMQEQMQAMQEQIAQLTAALNKAKPEQKAKPLVAAPPDYATPAQIVEYEKLAKRANELIADVRKAAQTESVSVFIAVPKKQDSMPHTIRFSCTYSK